MSFSPNKEDLEAGMEGVVARLEEALLCIKPLVMDPLFFPFTRPVLYGKQEDMVFKVWNIWRNPVYCSWSTNNPPSLIFDYFCFYAFFRLG